MRFFRLLCAGLFVFIILLVTVAITSNTLDKSTPPWLNGISMAVLLLGLCLAAVVLFNRPGPRAAPGRSTEDMARDLETRGLLTATDHRARRAFQVEEFEDEGSHYFIELEDGGVLYLCGQYLYEHEPQEDEPGKARPRTFPCSEFTILTHRTQGHVVDLRCGGRVLEPEAVLPHFTFAALRRGEVPEDLQVIRDRSYEELKKDFRAG